MFTLSIAVYSALLFASAVIRGSSIDASLDCSVLQTLNFRQHEAPEDISSVVSRITASANKELEGVEYIMMTWEGDFVHHAIGSYNIRTNVKIVGENGHRCYITLIRVEDTNECDERVPNEWQQRATMRPPAIGRANAATGFDLPTLTRPAACGAKALRRLPPIRSRDCVVELKLPTPAARGEDSNSRIALPNHSLSGVGHTLRITYIYLPLQITYIYVPFSGPRVVCWHPRCTSTAKGGRRKMNHHFRGPCRPIRWINLCMIRDIS